MSRRKASKQEFDAAADAILPKTSPEWVDDPIDATAAWSSGVNAMTREQKVATMVEIAETHLYSSQHNQCCCGFRPTDTPPAREFLEHVMIDIVDKMKL